MKVDDAIHCETTEEVREVLKVLWGMGHKYRRDKHQECSEEYLSEFGAYKAIFIRSIWDGIGGNYRPHPKDKAMSYREFMDKYANKRLRLLKALKTLE